MDEEKRPAQEPEENTEEEELAVWFEDKIYSGLLDE